MKRPTPKPLSRSNINAIRDASAQRTESTVNRRCVCCLVVIDCGSFCEQCALRLPRVDTIGRVR